MPNFYPYKEFLKHRLKARNRQGIHSPFVYKLLDEVIYFKGHYYNYDKVNSLRTRMLRDPQVITVTDMGAGSSKLGVSRTIRQIAQTSVKNKKLGELIYRLAVHQQAAISLELGTSLGITTSYLALANTKGKVYTIEGDAHIRKTANANFQSLGISNIHSLQGNFDELLDPLLETIDSVDLAFLDGNHRKKPTLQYIQKLLPKLKNGSLIIVDDIYWSRDMQEAWQEIIQIPEFTVTIDLFHFGLIFIRKEQTKEHFFIKI